MPSNHKQPLRVPLRLQAIRKQLEIRLMRRKVAKEILEPHKSTNIISKIKNIFSKKEV